MMSGDFHVAGSTLTVRRLMEILAEKDETYTLGTDPSKLINLPKATCISDGKGFASKIYSVLLETEVASHTVAIKLAQCTNQLGKSLDDDDKSQKERLELFEAINNRELAFYEFVTAHVLEKVLLVRYFYGHQMSADQQGIILMEDMSAKMKKVNKLGVGLKKEQIMTIIETLAVLQARSVLHQDKLLENFAHISITLKVMHQYISYCCKVLEERNLPWFPKERSEICQSNALPSNVKKLLSPNDKYGKLGAVMVHGDLWPNNMIWSDRETNEDLLAIVDYQCAHAGNYTADIAAALAVSMDVDDRRAHGKELLKYYTDEMNTNLEKLGLKQRLNYETVRASYKNSLDYAINQMIMTVVTNPKEDIPDHGETEGPLTRRLRGLVEDVFSS